MDEITTLKVRRTLHRKLVLRSRALGMYLGDYVERLLMLAMEKATDDPVEEFRLLIQYHPGESEGTERL